MSEAEDEDRLVERARGGDEGALRELLLRVSPGVRRGIAGRIPKRWRAMLSEDDVLQQSFTEVFLEISNFVPTGPGAFSAWVKRLARNNLLDAIRALEAEKRGGGRTHRRLGEEDSKEQLFGQLMARSRSSPSRRAARNEAVCAMDKALRQLPSDYEKVVRLYDLESRGIEEVARVLERSPGAVYLLRNRALGRLAELLSDHE